MTHSEKVVPSIQAIFQHRKFRMYETIRGNICRNDKHNRDFLDAGKTGYWQSFVVKNTLPDLIAVRIPSADERYVEIHVGIYADQYQDGDGSDRYVGVTRDGFVFVGHHDTTQSYFDFMGAKPASTRFIVSNDNFEGAPSRTLAGGNEPTVADDIKAIRDMGLDATTTKRWIDARLGQGKYRKSLLAAWGNACAITGIAVSEVIRASHIKPWRRCETPHERLTSNNGLPLLATLDALFDTGLISFDRRGRMLISKKLLEADSKALGLGNPLRLETFSGDNELHEFIEYHRKVVFHKD